MTQLEQKMIVPAAVMKKLETVRARTLWVNIGTALVVAVGVLLTGMGIAMLVDWLATLYDSSWRWLLTGSTLAAAGATLVVLAIVARRQSGRLDLVAAQIDREIPQLEERWTTVAEISKADAANNVHPAMFRQVASEANQWSPKVIVQQVVPLNRMIRALYCLALLTAVLGVSLLFNSHRTIVLLNRFWSPGSSISATTITDVSGTKVVGRGEALEIAATVEGTPTKYATLLLDSNKGSAQNITLVPQGKDEVRVSHRIRAVTAPLKYRIRAGDGQTSWQEIRVGDRPELGEVRLTIVPPAYTKEEPVVLEKFPHSISAMEGSVLRIALKPKAAVASFKIHLGGEQTESPSMDSEGWYRWETTLSKSFVLLPLLTEENGLTNRKPPRCKVKCLPDAPPVVRLITPENTIAILPDDTVSITFTAKDDVGIGRAELVLYGEGLDINSDPVPLTIIPIPLGDQRGASEVLATIDLDLSKYELTDGTELTYAIRVSEDRGGARSEGPAVVAEENITQKEDGAETTEVESPLDSYAASSIGNSSGNARSSETAAAQPRDAERSMPEQSEPAPKNLAVASPATTKPQDAADQDNSSVEDQPAAKGRQAEESKNETVGPSPSTDPSHTTQSEKATPAKKSPMEKPMPKTASTTPNRSVETSADKTKTRSEQKTAGNRTSTSPSKNVKTTATEKKDSKRSTSEKDSGSQGRPNQMSTRLLDIPPPQSTSSKRMLLRIDETAGSFSGQQRVKLEMAIAPRLAEIKQALQKAQQLSQSVLDDLPSPEAWDGKHGRDTTAAERQINAALKVVEFVEKRSKGTPYAFVGLQLVNISLAHIEPARREFWKALQADGESRVEALRNGGQHTGRAIDLLERLTSRFERARREYATVEMVEEIKKMYQVYVENALALLSQDGEDGSPYSRKRVEFDLDEEYLARLKEVLEMRNALRAELARILADDPRLLRRYLDAQRNRSRVLRNELANLTERQRVLNRKMKAWTIVEQEQRPKLASALIGRHVRNVEEIAFSAADLHDRFETWLPLERNVDDADLKATAELLQEIATATNEVSRVAGRYVGQQPKAENEKDEDLTSSDAQDETLATVVAAAEKLYSQFNRLEVLLRQIGLREDGAGLADFSTKRLLDTRKLIDQTSAWIRQLKSYQLGEIHRAVEIDQYRLAMSTDALAGKLADIEQSLAGLLQNDDGTLPLAIAEKAQTLLATLDEQVTPNQLAAVYALRRNQLLRANTRQASALEAFELAGRTYDEMIELTILELDKLPVDDPIASLLREPTLDELLRGLEQEADIRELLGIPRRPTNLQIIGDWMRSGGDNSLATGSGANQMLINQFQEQQRKRQRAIERAYRQALERAAKEANAANLVDARAAPARATKDWNVLASQLRDDLQQGRDSAPPERFRQAIEQYFRQISGSNDQQPASQQ